MIRYIKLEDENKRDLRLHSNQLLKNMVFLALEDGKKPINKKVIKSSKEFTLESLIEVQNLHKKSMMIFLKN